MNLHALAMELTLTVRIESKVVDATVILTNIGIQKLKNALKLNARTWIALERQMKHILHARVEAEITADARVW